LAAAFDLGGVIQSGMGSCIHNDVSSNVSPNASGSPSLCAVPFSEPATWYIKTTTDGGCDMAWDPDLGGAGIGKSLLKRLEFPLHLIVRRESAAA
jgi:hypothetical protein